MIGRKGWLGSAGIRQLLALGFGLVLLCLAAITVLAYQRLGSTVGGIRHDRSCRRLLRPTPLFLRGKQCPQVDRTRVGVGCNV